MISRRSPIRKKNKSNRGKARRRWGAGFESLEDRHLLSSVGLNNDGIVEVQGTEEGDEIAAFVDGEQFVVEINGATVGYNNADVKGLYVEALGGDDNVRVDNSVLQPTLIFGGIGNDTIQGGAGVDVILGGSDDDTIYGNTANDVLLGDGPNSLAEVPLPEPGEPPVEIAPDTPIIVDLAPVDPTDPNSGPLGLYKYLSRVSGINSGSDTIVGGTGSDLVFAGQQDDGVEGDGANVIPVPDDEGEDEGATVESSATTDVAPPDMLPPGNDYIEAGTGNDKVDAGYGANIVFGGAGNDTLVSGGGADIALGGSGDDTIETNGGNDTVLGDGPNTINQVILTSNNYYLANSALGSGNDYIEAGAGDDHVFTGDVFTGDTIATGVNLVFGGAGDDRIYGGRGRDGIVGGGGNDTIRSGASADVVLGDGPNSLAELPIPVLGEPPLVDLASDLPAIADIAPIDPTDPNPLPLLKYLSRVSGINAGRDTIVAGTGNDLVFAGARNDKVDGDGANVYPVATVVVTAAAAAPGLAAVDEEFAAPPGNDYIEAGRGNDTVDAGYGTNVVFGGTGRDTLTSGAGDDIVIGGSGGDVIRTHGGADKVLGDGPATINQVIIGAADIYLANSALGRGRDYIESGAGEDTVYTGRDRDAVFAGAGDDFAHGGPGSDLLVGGTGADTLIGGRGNDVIITGGPNFGPFVDPIDDLVNALSQDGELVYDQSNDYVEAGHGNDLVFAFGGHDLVFGGSGADNLFAGPGNDILVGGSGNDNIRAGGGNDVALGDGPNSLADAILPLEPPASAVDPNWLGVLLANSQLGRGDDVIDGGAGNDLMFGGAATDMIFGRTGNDLLHGGRGDDELHDDLNSGGDGIDIFIGDLGADKIFANDGPGGPVDFIFFDVDDELHVDGEDELIPQP